eukprot:4373-Rhodomonas_salina.1
MDGLLQSQRRGPSQPHHAMCSCTLPRSLSTPTRTTCTLASNVLGSRVYLAVPQLCATCCNILESAMPTSTHPPQAFARQPHNLRQV